MRAACTALAVVTPALALGACGGSDEEKAHNTVCDDDISAAQSDLGSDRRTEAEAADKAFTTSVHQKTFAPLNCN